MSAAFAATCCSTVIRFGHAQNDLLTKHAGFLFFRGQLVVLGLQFGVGDLQLFADLSRVDKDVLDLLLRNADVVRGLVLFKIIAAARRRSA